MSFVRVPQLQWSRRTSGGKRAEIIAAGPSKADGPAPALWSAAHASLLDGLFGDGYVNPGGAEEVARLVRPIGLSADQSVLLVGAGTGGPVLSLAMEYRVRVEAYEAVEAFVDVAADRVERAGLGARASVALWSRSAPFFRQQAFDHAPADHALALAPLGGAEPDKMLGAIGGAVRPGGHLVLQDFVVAPPFHDDAAMKSWRRLERRPAAPPDEATLAGILERLGFKVRMTEDVTRRALGLAMAGWRRMLQTLERRAGPAAAAVLAAETERWLACSELMRAGRLKLLCWHAIRDGAGDLDVGSLKLEIMLAVQFRNWHGAMAIWETVSQMPALDAESRSLRAFIRSGIARDPGFLPEVVRAF